MIYDNVLELVGEMLLFKDRKDLQLLQTTNEVNNVLETLGITEKHAHYQQLINGCLLVRNKNGEIVEVFSTDKIPYFSCVVYKLKLTS